MDTKNAVKEAKFIMRIALIVGVILLAAGTAFSLAGINPVSSNKGLIALSLIPLSVALVYFTKFSKTINSSKTIKSRVIQETDERLVASSNETDAQSFKIVQAALFLGYMGYTIFVPEDVFQSVGWWILMSLLMISFLTRAVLAKRSCVSVER